MPGSLTDRSYEAAGRHAPGLRTQAYELLTPQVAGTAVAGLVQADAATVAPAYLLTRAGLQKLP